MTDTTPAVYPLKFRPIYKEKIWGGRRLEQLGRTLPGGRDALIGESWELADLGQTSTAGGGGGEARSVIANGALAGQALQQAISVWGKRLLGRLPLTDSGGFPLLVKYLDSRQDLSVQVHPSEDYARAHPKAHLKSEAWYILDADAGAAIYKGVREGVTAEQFRAAIATGTREAVEAMLIRVPVKKGDCHYLPSGTCHALGAGILVAEVQTPSDTTFRVYDWGRPAEIGRELHVAPAMQCIHWGPPDVARQERRTHLAGMFTAVSCLVMCEHFRIEKVRMTEGYEQEVPYDQPAVWMVLEGNGQITTADAPAVDFARGDTLLMPAKMNDPRVKLNENTVWLEISFPRATSMQLA